MTENLAASIKARLLNIAKKELINFNQILLLYFYERLLYRLSVSKYNSSFFLKGGIAEKFESMLNLAFINSRMKDFYDIYTLSTSKSFDGRVLQEAIFETTQKRGTILKEDPAIFTTEFIEKKEQMWGTYLRKIGKQQLKFSKVIRKLEDFLAPIYGAIIEEDEFLKKWNNEKGQWELFLTALET